MPVEQHETRREGASDLQNGSRHAEIPLHGSLVPSVITPRDEHHDDDCDVDTGDLFDFDDPELSPEGWEEVCCIEREAFARQGIAGVHFTGPQAFSSTGRTPASASAPAIAGLCPSPQNGQLASTIPIHVGANPISEVRGPSGSTSQHPTSYNDGQHPTPSNLNSARTELQHLDSATGNEVPLQSSGQEKQGRLTLKQLRDLAARSQTHPFFTPYQVFDLESDGDDGDDGYGSEEEDEEEDNEMPGEDGSTRSGKTAWFKQPKNMPQWLYEFFATTIAPLIYVKEGRKLVKPAPLSDDSRSYSPPTLWIHPPEPSLLLSRYRFDPATLWRPRIFLWLPHFYVKQLHCPHCNHILEKNGAADPRRICDVEDNFYAVTWKYYCRLGCKSTFRGWSTSILKSLPPYLQLAFPAVLSRRAGISRQVITQLRVSNQHKMGPTGYRSLLLENHTLKFNILQAQYLEAAFEMVRGQQLERSQTQTTLHYFMPSAFPAFGNFSDPPKYAGFVPTEGYLASMMNKAIELDEADANQHTACLAPDQIAIDDSHKVNKHIAKVDGVPVFTALWTCMDSRYIRAQALTLTKAHEERSGPLSGIAKSIKLYGHDDPSVLYSDDPVKDKPLLSAAFPSLFENLTPIAAAYGLTALELPPTTNLSWLGTSELTESTLSSVMASVDLDPEAHLCISLDMEWNVSRRIGVSIMQIALHSQPDIIYIIPVHKFNDKLPPSLLRLLISKQVFKIGSSIKADITRLKKQFPMLTAQNSFNLIDLKEYCIERGLIERKASGSLEALCEKVLCQYLPKEQRFRKSEEWEAKKLTQGQLLYAACDVLASRLIFEKATKMSPIARPQYDSPAGSRIALLAQEGGDPIAYGTISPIQPTSLGTIRVKTLNRNRLVLDINTVVCPSAAVMLHLPISSTNSRKGKTKSGALTLEQLRTSSSVSSNSTFKVVSQLSLIEFDGRQNVTLAPCDSQESQNNPLVDIDRNLNVDRAQSSDTVHQNCSKVDAMSSDASHSHNDDEPEGDQPQTENDLVALDMLEAYSQVAEISTIHDSAPMPAVALALQKIIDSPLDVGHEYTPVKKDIFHAFHMIPMAVNHGARPLFLRAMRDHLMRWDPAIRATVDEICRKVFKLSFDQMLLRNPRFIAERTPRHVPAPSILVPALRLVFDTFGNALDVKTNLPLFNAEAHRKANAVLELARQGYLSDIEGVSLYERAGIDKYGLQKWKCLRGTNNVEGGPHGDIYRKFGALHAGPRLTVNCLTDHRTWYNLQAFAKHIFGVDWEYHHQLGLINRTSFLLNYLSDSVDGASSYSEWLNGDLYERTEEKFGICVFPGKSVLRLDFRTVLKLDFRKLNDLHETLRIRLGMEPYTEEVETRYKLNSGDSWLRKRQGLALPVLPPTTPEARKFFFSKIREFAAIASESGKSKINFEAFAQEWNQSANGEDRFYVTTEVLSAYSKTWEKCTNIRASQELISDQLEVAQQTANVFAAEAHPFPTYLTGIPTSTHPREGVVEIESSENLQTSSTPVPDSLSVDLALSRPQLPIPDSMIDPILLNTPRPPQTMPRSTPIMISSESESTPPSKRPSAPAVNEPERPTKRRRVVPDNHRKRQNMRKCRRCHQETCPGNNNIANCPVPCTVPCKACKRLSGCRGVDGGRLCSASA